MNGLTLYTKISQLQNSEQLKVIELVDSLLNTKKSTRKQKHPKSGCMKGTFTMSDDFDAPLEDFQEYMQ
ncbi:MAG: DUF2281 domain-containing protein [Bacteroidetes bacterium]|nr:MAG: DUF2281 domain-containing protein [Bacteroidota bacterium]